MSDIQTAELVITIQTVKVDGKKMTLAMFRQIPCRIIAPSDFNKPEIKTFGYVDYDRGDDDWRRWLVLSDNGILMKASFLITGEDSVIAHKEGVDHHEKELAKLIAAKADKVVDPKRPWAFTTEVAQLDLSIANQKSAHNHAIRRHQRETKEHEVSIEAFKCPQLYIAV